MTKSYTERDIVALRAKLIQQVRDTTSTWTDFSASDIGMVLIECLATCVDFSQFYLDRQVNEVFLDRAEEPKNIRSHLLTMNYRIPFTTPPTAEVEFLIKEPLKVDIIIPKYTQLHTFDTATPFLTTQKSVLPARMTSTVVPVIQGKLEEIEESVDNLKVESSYYIDVDDLAKTLADKSIRVIDSKGEWEQVPDAFLKYEGGRYFSVHQDSRDMVYLLFTWDWQKQLPSDPEEIVKIQYVTTKGLDGNVAKETIKILSDHLFTADKQDVTDKVKLYNRNPSSGGEDIPDLYKMIVDAKSAVRRMGKLVTLNDYHTAVLGYGGVFKAVTQDWSVPNTKVLEPYKVITWCISKQKVPFTQAFLTKMAADLYSQGIAIVKFETNQAELFEFDIHAEIKIKSDDPEIRLDIRKQVITNLQDTFGYGKLEFGQAILWDDIRDVIKHTHPNITTVNMITPTIDSRIENIVYPTLRDLQIEVVGDKYGN